MEKTLNPTTIHCGLTSANAIQTPSTAFLADSVPIKNRFAPSACCKIFRKTKPTIIYPNSECGVHTHSRCSHVPTDILSGSFCPEKVTISDGSDRINCRREEKKKDHQVCIAG